MQYMAIYDCEAECAHNSFFFIAYSTTTNNHKTLPTNNNRNSKHIFHKKNALSSHSIPVCTIHIYFIFYNIEMLTDYQQ